MFPPPTLGEGRRQHPLFRQVANRHDRVILS